MRSRYHQLWKASSQISPLRYYSIATNTRNHRLTSTLLTMNNHYNPSRGLVTEAAWGIAGLSVAHRVWERLCDEDNCWGYSHPCGFFAALAATVSCIKHLNSLEDFDDKVNRHVSDIFYARASSDKNVLMNYFRNYLRNDNNTSKDLFILLTAVKKTETLETLLESTKDLSSEHVKKLFDAVQRHETLPECNTFLKMAELKGVGIAVIKNPEEASTTNIHRPRL